MLTNQQVNVFNAVESFLKIEYIDGLTNEFNVQDSLVNNIKKDNITGEKIEKSFALGVTDNVRTMGMGNDTYVLGINDFPGGAETVTAEYKADAKFMALFGVTHETIIKGTTGGSIVDLIADNLNRMKLNLKNTYQRSIYGASSGLIGTTDIKNADATWTTIATKSGSFSKWILTCDITNSHSLLPGTGILFYIDQNTWFEGKIWQMETGTLYSHKAHIIIENAHTNVVSDVNDSGATIAIGASDTTYNVYGKQLQYNGTAPYKNYTGIQDIMFTADNTIFGVDRSVYKSLNPTIVDLDLAAYGGPGDGSGGLVTEEILRDLSDHIDITAGDDAKISLVASKARIIASIEKQMLQFKTYDMDNNKDGFQLGRPKIQFDGMQLHKDKFSRDQNVALLDPNKIGELVRSDFAWISQGQVQSVLSRRDGSEMFEGIMTKYGDMRAESFKGHAAFTNAKETVA